MELIWQQIVTHAIGFLLIVWLMKKFAWGPLMSMVEERRERIVSDFRAIDTQKVDVEKLRSQYEGKLRELETERRQKLIEGAEEGRKVANELKAGAQAEAKEIITRAKTEALREVVKARVQLKEDMVRMTMSATEQILQQKLTADKDRELVATYLDKLEKAS